MASYRRSAGRSHRRHDLPEANRRATVSPGRRFLPGHDRTPADEEGVAGPDGDCAGESSARGVAADGDAKVDARPHAEGPGATPLWPVGPWRARSVLPPADLPKPDAPSKDTRELVGVRPPGAGRKVGVEVDHGGSPARHVRGSVSLLGHAVQRRRGRSTTGLGTPGLASSLR
jgi:hypothetical protein